MPQQTSHLVEIEPFSGIYPQSCSVCGKAKWGSNNEVIAEGWKQLQTAIRKYLLCPGCVRNYLNNK